MVDVSAGMAEKSAEFKASGDELISCQPCDWRQQVMHIVIVGYGLAGRLCALALAPHAKVSVLTQERALKESAAASWKGGRLESGCWLRLPSR